MRRPIALRLAVLLVAGVLALGGCGSTTPPHSPSAPAGSTPPTNPVSTPTTGPVLAGLSWVRAPDVARPEGAFALPSSEPTLSPSDNGRSGHPHHFPGQAPILDVTLVDGSLVAVGYTFPSSTAAAWVSRDGLSWQVVSISPATPAFAVAVAGRSGVVVAVGHIGSAPAAWLSRDDGRTWSQADIANASSGAAARMTDVVATADGFVAGGSSGPEIVGPQRARFWRSADGSHWQVVTDDGAFADSTVTGLTDGGGALVAVGLKGTPEHVSGSVAWTSLDGGRRWIRHDDPALLAGQLNAVAAGPQGGFVAVGATLQGDAAEVWRSADGATWEHMPGEPSRLYNGHMIRMTDIALHDGALVAVGNYNPLQFGTATAWRSTDGGIHWEQTSGGPAMEQGEMNGVVADGGFVVAVGSFGAPDNYIPATWISPGP